MEGGEHEALLALEQAVLAHIEQFAKCPVADKARVQQLSAAIQDKLSKIRALTRDLELEVEELDTDEERAVAAAQLAQHKAAYAATQAALRDAAVVQRTTALKSAAEERRELLAGGDVGTRQRKLQAEGDAVAMAEDLTGGLRRTRQVLVEELEHTNATLAAMETSHAALGRTRDEYHGQHLKLRQSRGLLGTLNWQAKSETYMLWFGLTIFLAVCAYVAQKRASHFLPEALKPATLLGGLTGGSRTPVGAPISAGRPQAPAPTSRLRADAPPHRVHQPGSDTGGSVPYAPAVPVPAEVQDQRALPLPPPVPFPTPADLAGDEVAAGEDDLAGWPAPAPYAHYDDGQHEEEHLPAYDGQQHRHEPELEQHEQYQELQYAEEQQHQQGHQEEQQHGEGAHEPAEWPSQAPVPDEQQADAAAAPAEQQQRQEQQAQAQQEQQAPLGEAPPEQEHEQYEAHAYEQPATEEPVAEDAPREPAPEAAELEPQAATTTQQLAAAAAAAVQQELQPDAQAAQDAAVGPEVSPEPPMPAGQEQPASSNAAAAAHAAAAAVAQQQEQQEQLQQDGDGRVIVDPQGLRIAVDGPDFVRIQPQPEPPLPPQQAAAGEQAAAEAQPPPPPPPPQQPLVQEQPATEETEPWLQADGGTVAEPVGQAGARAGGAA